LNPNVMQIFNYKPPYRIFTLQVTKEMCLIKCLIASYY